MKSTLNKTSNWFRTVGTLSETNLKLEDCDIKLRDADGKPNGTTPGQRIMGNVSVKTDNGVHTFSVYAQSLTSKGESSKQWKMYSDMLEWIPEIGGGAGSEPTLVNIEGSVAINDYVNQQGEVSSTLRWRVGRGNTKASPDEPKGTTLKATLFIGKITPEIVNEEETGRLVVELYAAENNGTCFPVVAYVGKDMADDFADCYEVGMTVPFEFELISRHIGGTAKAGKKKFGRDAEVSVNSGFDRTELILVGGDDEIEEPDEDDEDSKSEYIYPETMRAALKERKKMLEELKANPPKRESKGNKSGLQDAKKQAAKDKMKSGMKAKATASFEEMDGDDDLPF